MKKIIHTILFIFLATAIPAQKYTITKGKELGEESQSQHSSTFGEDDKYYYKYRYQRKTKADAEDYIIEKYDKATLKKIWEADSKYSDFKGEYVYGLNEVFAGGKILLFTKTFDKTAEVASLMMKIMNTDGKQEKNWTELTQLHSDGFGISGRNFYERRSPDRTKLIVVSEFVWGKKPQEVTAQRYNPTTMEKIGKEITLPGGYKAGGIRTSDYKVDDKGNFSYLFYYLASPEDEEASIALGIIPQEAKEPKVVELTPEAGKQLSNYTVAVMPDGKMLLTGFFKDKKVKHSKVDLRAGIYSFIIDMNGSLAYSEMKYFPDEVEKKLHYKDGLVEAETGKKYYGIREMMEMGGEYYLFANQSYTISNNNSSTNIEREFVVTKYDKKGKIQWTKVYPKYTRDRLNSYNMMVHNNKIYVFYLEHPKNLENSDLQDYDAKRYHDIKDYHGSVMVAMEINPDGTASRKKIEETEDWFYDPSGNNTLLEKENSLLLRMINGKRERFDILTVE